MTFEGNACSLPINGSSGCLVGFNGMFLGPIFTDFFTVDDSSGGGGCSETCRGQSFGQTIFQ